MTYEEFKECPIWLGKSLNDEAFQSLTNIRRHPNTEDDDTKHRFFSTFFKADDLEYPTNHFFGEFLDQTRLLIQAHPIYTQYEDGRGWHWATDNMFEAPKTFGELLVMMKQLGIQCEFIALLD